MVRTWSVRGIMRRLMVNLEYAWSAADLSLLGIAVNQTSRDCGQYNQDHGVQWIIYSVMLTFEGATAEPFKYFLKGL